MNPTASSEMVVNPVSMYMTKGGDEKGGTNMTFNISGNMTGDSIENEGQSFNYESYTLYNLAYYMSLYPWLLMAFGVPGNVASIFTIMSMTTVSSSKAHVAILAITDTVSILMKVIYWQASGYQIQLTVPGCALIMFVQQFSTCYANWVVVAMTTERFLAVWFPLRVGRMYTRRKALIVLGCLALTTSAVYLFFFWAWTEMYEEDYGFWCTMKPEYETFIQNFYWFDGFYYAILPCLLVLIGNVLIITNIKRARKAQRHLTNAFDKGGRKARDQRQITVMLIVVSVVFLLLNVPSAIFYFAKVSWTFERPSYEHVKYIFTARFLHMLADANHAVNFYLYFLSMSSFRRRFLDAVRCRRHLKRRPANNSMSRTSQTYLQCGHHSCDPARLESSTGYSAYKRSSSNITEHAHPLKSLSSNNNRASHDHQSLGSHSCINSASSNV